MKMELKFDWIDALIVAIVAPLVVGIILIFVQEWVDESETIEVEKPETNEVEHPIIPEPPVVPPDIVAQLKSLQNPDAPFKVAIWINNVPGITQFTTEDKVVLHYQVSDLSPEQTAYFTLFNVSPTGELSQLLLNKPINGDTLYSVPEPQMTLEVDAFLTIMPQLTLEKGHEYFKAIVTLDEIAAKKLMTAPQEELQQTTWGTKSLTLQVFD